MSEYEIEETTSDGKVVRRIVKVEEKSGCALIIGGGILIFLVLLGIGFTIEGIKWFINLEWVQTFIGLPFHPFFLVPLVILILFLILSWGMMRVRDTDFVGIFILSSIALAAVFLLWMIFATVAVVKYTDVGIFSGIFVAGKNIIVEYMIRREMESGWDYLFNVLLIITIVVFSISLLLTMLNKFINVIPWLNQVEPDDIYIFLWKILFVVGGVYLLCCVGGLIYAVV